MPALDHHALQRTEVGGLPISPLTMHQLVSEVAAGISRGQGGWVITANLDHLRRFQSDALSKNLLLECPTVVADGVPVLWLAKLAGTPLPEKVSGSDLIFTLTSELAKAAGRLLLVGGSSDEVGSAAASTLRGLNPNIGWVGHTCPWLDDDGSGEQLEKVRDLIRAESPDVVMVGMGFPKQDLVIKRLREEFDSVWFIGVGVSIDFVAGTVRRAPSWMQRSGLEWLFRLAVEPRKLYRRYLLEGLPYFARIVFASLKVRRVGRRQGLERR